MCTMASQTPGVSIVGSTICTGADQRKHQSSASLASVREIHRSPVVSPRKGPVGQIITCQHCTLISVRIFMIYGLQYNLILFASRRCMAQVCYLTGNGRIYFCNMKYRSIVIWNNMIPSDKSSLEPAKLSFELHGSILITARPCFNADNCLQSINNIDL